jgi:ABC-type transport system involved in cytochrome bd biosynthesis fused ATPase/permease subunit
MTTGLTPATGSRHARAFDRRLLGMAAQERAPLAVAVALGLVVAATRVGQGVALAYGLGAILVTGRWSPALPWLALAVGLVLARAAALVVQGAAMAGASVRITTRLRVRLVATMLALGPGWLGRERSGELEAVLVDGVERLDAYFRLFLAKLTARWLGHPRRGTGHEPVRRAAAAGRDRASLAAGGADPGPGYEAVSNLDAEAERDLHQALRRVAAGTTTTTIIAHRPSTMRLADRIIVLEHGEAAPAGRRGPLSRAGCTG